ncbi:hypothetical protein GQ44DRAFT_707227 [Phaeosphaeriaceae sp. PMI808]|nr:hypothetical protein GQ44DRAFT_707227 [Phaeosphaeriaceae sp. PMI808]
MEAEDSELALSRSASKKSKKKKGKKGQKIADEAESEPLASEPIDEPPYHRSSDRSRATSATTPFEETQRTMEPEPESVMPEYPSAEGSHDTTAPTPEPVPDAKEDITEPPTTLSPTLQAVQDEAADLRLRSEALDQAIDVNEQLDATPSSEPTSFFDVVGKLSKKEKKKGKKAKGTAINSESTTPVADTKAVVETKDIVEQRALPDVASPKQSPPNLDEPFATPSHNVAPIEELQQPLIEPTISQPDLVSEISAEPIEDIKPISLDESTNTVENVRLVSFLEPQESLVVEQPLLEKLGKKEKNKMEQGMQVDEAVSHATEMLPETRNLTTTEEPSAVPFVPLVETPEVVTGISESQETAKEEEQPSVSRKLGKKDKKKQNKAALPTVEEPVPEADRIISETIVQTREPAIPETIALPELVSVSDESMNITHVPEIQEAIVEEAQRPSLSRKLSKKDKKEAEQSELNWNENTELRLEPTPLTDVREASIDRSITKTENIAHPSISEPEPEPSNNRVAEPLPQRELSTEYMMTPVVDIPIGTLEQPSISHAEELTVPALNEDANTNIPAVVADVNYTPMVEQTTELATHPEPSETIDTIVRQDEDVVTAPEDEHAFIAPALTRKQSKKGKKKGKKNAVADDKVDEPIEQERGEDVEMRDAPHTVDTPAELPQAREPEVSAAADLPTNTIPDDVATIPSKGARTDDFPDGIETQTRSLTDEITATKSLVPEIEDELNLSSKKSKKQKRKSKTATTPLNESIEESQPPTPREEASEQIIPLEPIEAEDQLVRSPKKSKKEKRKPKTDEPIDVPQDSPSEEDNAGLTTKPLKSEVEFVSKTPKKDQKFKTVALVSDEEAIPQIEVGQDLSKQPTTTEPATDLSIDTQPPTLNKKSSRKHKLASLFEQGASNANPAAERELRKEGTGSVKNLAEQYESQSRSITPVLLPASEKRSRRDDVSPGKGIDFAGTIAAGLNLSGFDDKFHHPSSPHAIRDITTEDDVAAALDSASSSRFATRGWTTPISSPKLRPTREAESDVLPPIEVAIASTDTVSFDPLDAINDPIFSKRTTSPGVLEEADPEELGSKLKMNKKPKGKKKRKSLPESPLDTSATDDVPASIPDNHTDTASRGLALELPDVPSEGHSLADQSHLVSGKEQRPATFETIQDDTWAATPTPKSKKSKKEKKRASIMADSVEYAAAETPVHPTVETPVDSTARDIKLEEILPSAPLSVAPISPKPREYPFPQTSLPEKTANRNDQHEVVEEPRKGKERQRNETVVDKEEKTHKRRSHPVTFKEDQPSEHKQSPATTNTHEVQSTSQELNSSLEPTCAVEVADSPVQSGAPSFQESTRDIIQQDQPQEPEKPAREKKKKRSKEPKTPREKTPRDDHGYAAAAAIAAVVSPAERASHLFDSSPSTRTYGTPPVVEPITPAHDSRGAVHSPTKDRKSLSESHKHELSPTKEVKQEEPYVSIFGDPNEKASGSNKQLHTITETSPDDPSVHKKGRALNDIGAPDRGTKSAQRLNRKGGPQALETADSPPARRMPRSSPSFDPIKQHIAEQRSPSVASQRSMNQERPLSSASNLDRSASGDLRAVAHANISQPNLSGIALAAGASAAIAGIAAASKYDPVRGSGKGRRASMAETFEAWGEASGSPMSPTRPPSVRKRASIQILDLQSQLEQLSAHNQSLEDAKVKAEETFQAVQHQRQIDEQLVAEAAEARDREIHQKNIDIAQLRDTLQRLHEEIARLTELNNTLTEANRNLANDTNERYAQLQSEGQIVQQQWEASQRELQQLQTKHEQVTRGMEDVVRGEIGIILDDRNAEIDRLTAELAGAKEQVKTLQKQILAAKKPSESFLTIRDEDYFDSACQQLCQHVQQWVLRFSKFSDTRPCRLSSEIAADTRLDTGTRQKIDTRLDNAVLDGSDVDSLLADRVKRRDVFMSVVMTMIWEYVFTRYLFGMDREQRQKLKSLEKTLSEIGPPRAVAQWRAITLTLLSKREAFMQQRAQDTEAVVHEIYSTLSTLLSPPSHLQRQIQESLRNVMRLAVELSIEMRTQRAEYIMLPPLQPEYDTNGDLIAKVTFNASLMNERSGHETSNDELESRGAIVKIVLFPLVVKKGDDFGEGDDEIVVCPAQVLVARPRDKKVVRMLSGAMSIDRPNSRASRMTSVAPESSIMDYSVPGGNMI